MTQVVGAVETIVNSVGALRTVAGELRTAIGDHALIAEVEKLAGDIEAAVADVPQAVNTVEKVAETVWEKIREGFDDLLHRHTQTVVATVKEVGPVVADAVTTAVADVVADVVASSPTAPAVPTPGGTSQGQRVVGGPSSGAPAGTQPLPGPAPIPGPSGKDNPGNRLVDTGKVDADGNKIMDAPHGTPDTITIT